MNIQQMKTNERICPFIQEPLDECYCNSMSSQDIEKTIFYCSGAFKTCVIYKLQHPVMYV